LKEGNHVEDLCVGRRDDNIKIDRKEIRCESLGSDKDNRWGVVIVVMKFGLNNMWGIWLSNC
jgi:hypothetical protein